MTTKLVKRMEAYRESARVPGAGRGAAHWTAFAAATGSALAMASSASASIIYTNPGSPVKASIAGLAPSPVFRTSFNDAFFEVAGIAGPDRFEIFVFQSASSSTVLNGRAGIMGFSGAHPNLSQFSGNPGKTFFVPLSFGGDNGWVRLEYFDGSNGRPDEIEAIDWAYNTVPGAPIPPGTPEPSTAAMALLAAGSAGVLAWRRPRAAKRH